jgi:hypothetical protein
MGTLHVMTPGQLRWRRRMYNNSIVALMKNLGLPMTRLQYIALAYGNKKFPDLEYISSEEEAEIPVEFRKR